MEFTGTIAAFAKTVKQHSELNRLLKAALAPSLAEHCQVMNLRDGVLVLGVDSGAWLFRLRFELDALTREFQRTFPVLKIQSIELKVKTPEPPKIVPVPPRPEPLSSYTRDLLQATAAGIKNPKLKEALLQLAREKGLV